MARKCRGSAVEVPLKIRRSATDLPLLAPPLSTVGLSKTARFNHLEEEKPDPPFFENFVTGQYKEYGHAYKHCDSKTESAKWADSVKTN